MMLFTSLDLMLVNAFVLLMQEKRQKDARDRVKRI